MEGYQIVHKVVLFDDGPKMCIVFLKLLNEKDPSDIRFKAGVVDKRNPELVDVEDLNEVKNNNLEVASGALDMFLLKADYDETDLLGEDQVAIKIDQ